MSDNNALFPAHVIMPEEVWREYQRRLWQAEQNYNFEASLRRDSLRYQWLRTHGAWETEAFLNDLTPDQYEKELDKRMELDP